MISLFDFQCALIRRKCNFSYESPICCIFSENSVCVSVNECELLLFDLFELLSKYICVIYTLILIVDFENL